MKRRLYISFLLIPVLVCAVVFTTYAVSADTIKVFINDKPTTIEARQIDGEVYVPLKAVEDGLGNGTKVDFDSKENTVRINRPFTDVTSVISSVSPSVVGIMGKVKKGSIYYNAALKEKNVGFGTGVIIRSNGYIITNSHVVKEFESLIVILSNGKSYPARVKASDEGTDLAMIKIDKGGLKAAVLGYISDITVGETVVAIGTPLSLSLRNSASQGIVSGLNRSIQSQYRFIQSDAAINGGNSGGPLVNMQGKIIGINSIKYTGLGVEGLSFSIPVDTVKYAIDHFFKYGKIVRPYLGVTFSEGAAAAYGLPSNEGLVVSEIEKDSAAKAAGFKINDEVVAVNGAKITTLVDYNEEMKRFLPGDKAEFTVLRNDETLKLQVTFGKTPETIEN